MMRRVVVLAVVAIIILAAGAALAAAGDPMIVRHVIAGGGGTVSADAYVLHATVGQSVAGVAGAINPNGSLCAGFWCGMSGGESFIYLPLILRG